MVSVSFDSATLGRYGVGFLTRGAWGPADLRDYELPSLETSGGVREGHAALALGAGRGTGRARGR
ncbi:hypothetical protein GCM10027075_51340 [Streptomyces heilongjiangensis]